MNIKMKTFISIAFIISIVLSSVFIFLGTSLHRNSFGYERFKSGIMYAAPQEKHEKQFLYMYNVAECLPLDILTNDTLLDGTNRDILVLSYSSPCKRKDPAHIEYMFTGNKTTWGEGRNMLYWAAKDRKKHYLYYIFSDGDIKLVDNNLHYPKGVTKDFERFKNSEKNNFVKFENVLMEYKPAIASVENQFAHQNIFVTYQFPIDVRLNFMIFDAQFNGYHHSVLDDLLPYDNRHQKFSYWTSQAIQQCRAFLRYHGHVFSVMPIIGLNNAHSSYPRGIPAKYGITCKEEFQKAPVKFQESPLAKKVGGHSILTLKNNFIFMAESEAVIAKYSDYSFSIVKNNSKSFV